MRALLREREGAEGARKAAEGGGQGCAPGRWRGGAALFRHTSAQEAHPAGGGGKGRGLVGLGQREGLGLNTTRAGRAPGLWPSLPSTSAAPGAPEWRVPHQVQSRTPKPVACLHIARRRTRPSRTSF